MFKLDASLLRCRKHGDQSEEPVGDQRGRDHGGAAAWMIFVQRGNAESGLPYRNCSSVCLWSHLRWPASTSPPSAGGFRAVLSEAPAGRAWGPSGRRGEGKHRHRDRGLPTALRRGHLHWWRGEWDFLPEPAFRVTVHFTCSHPS